ncbi:MAG TPA: PilZ domain-containing protein [Kofleriaceae bacterium]|nr:PilZ domain-containing protein [Kofleriaceae bacterium]
MARTVVLELAGQAALARDLAAGGVLVPDVLDMGEDVDLHLRGSGDELRVSAKCVWVNGDKGSGLQLFGCDAEMKQKITSLAAAASATTSDSPTADTPGQPAIDAPADPDETVDEDAEDADADAKKAPLNVHERLRGLTLAQQIKMAHNGEVAERIVLERMYGKAVWEGLLRNPRLTGPEVARIARMGALPRPLMEIILGNGGWLQIPEVRRALLTNPRLGTDQITKILRLLPKHELKMAAMQTIYPFAVRDVAKRLLKELGIGT